MDLPSRQPTSPAKHDLDDASPTASYLYSSFTPTFSIDKTVEYVMWGRRVLSQREPFAEGVVFSDNNTVRKLIFLTDG